MFHKTILILRVIGFALILFAGTRAMAADLKGSIEPPVEPPIGPSSFIFNGAYWGISGGYGWGESEHNYERNDDHGLATTDLTGGVASLTLGYNYLTRSNFLFGAEADIGWMGLSSDDQVIFDGHIWKSQFGPFWGTARLRAGYLMGATLLYATGGAAFMSVDEVGYGDADGQTAENTDFRTGWTVGGGIEHAFNPKMALKFEYLYMDFGRYDGFSENAEAFYFDNTVNIVRAGLNVKF